MVVKREQVTYDNVYDLSGWCGGLAYRIYDEIKDQWSIGILINEDIAIKEGDWIEEYEDGSFNLVPATI